MKFCKPNLPSSKVKKMLVSSILPQNIVDELILLGIEPIKLGKNIRIKSELAYHPDILTFNYKAGKWLVEFDCEYFPGNILYTPEKYMNELLTPIKYHIGNKYPADCIFNSFVVGNTIFSGFVNTGMYENIEELNGYNIISFKQGYAKCSVIPIDENAFITSDKSIYKKLTELHFDCLFADNDCIKLNGYSNGFIGGCAGKAAENLLVFTGNIELHNGYNNIKNFCMNHGVDVYSLSDDQLYDYGGLLPVIEE